MAGTMQTQVLWLECQRRLLRTSTRAKHRRRMLWKTGEAAAWTEDLRVEQQVSLLT